MEFGTRLCWIGHNLAGSQFLGWNGGLDWLTYPLRIYRGHVIDKALSQIQISDFPCFFTFNVCIIGKIFFSNCLQGIPSNRKQDFFRCFLLDGIQKFACFLLKANQKNILFPIRAKFIKKCPIIFVKNRIFFVSY